MSFPKWTLDETFLIRDFEFKDFKEAMDFVNQVARIAETTQHHPDIQVSYNKVKLALSTHSAGGVTEQDFDLAGQIDQIENKTPEVPQRAA